MMNMTAFLCPFHLVFDIFIIVLVAEVDRLQRYISKIYPAAGSVAVVSFRTDNNTLTLDSGSVVQRHRAQQLQHVLSGGSSSGSPEASSLNVAAEEGPATSGAAPGHASVSRITHLISHLGERFALVSVSVTDRRKKRFLCEDLGYRHSCHMPNPEIINWACANNPTFPGHLSIYKPVHVCRTG